MNLLGARRQPHTYEHVSQNEHSDDETLSPTVSHDSRDDTHLDPEVAYKAYPRRHERSRSNSSLSSISSYFASFTPGAPRYLRRQHARPRSRIRFLLLIAKILLLVLFLWVVLTPIVNPSYVSRPYHYSGRNLRREKVFIAANIVDEDLIRGPWGERVVELVDLLGYDNVFLSIYENDSGPGTKAALQELGKKVQCECIHYLPSSGHHVGMKTRGIFGTLW